MERTDTEMLLDSMIDHIRKDQHIDDLNSEIKRLRHEIALLNSRLDVLVLRRLTAIRSETHALRRS